MKKSGMFVYLYICMDVRKAFLYFDPRVLCLVSVCRPLSHCTKLISGLSISTRITLEIELVTVLNSFAVQFKRDTVRD